MDKVAGVEHHPNATRDSKANMAKVADLTRVTDKEVTGVDLRVANKVMVSKDKVDIVELPVIRAAMVVKAMAVQLDNQVATAWAMTIHKKVADNLLMVVEDGVVSKDSNQVVRANHNLVHHHKKEKAANKSREIKTRTGIARV